MTKVLVLYYSSYGHIEQVAHAVAEGARTAGAVVAVKRVPELIPDEVARASYYKLDQSAPTATPDELADYDAIIIGTPTRFGNMAAQMKQFLDQTGGLLVPRKVDRQGRLGLHVDCHPARGQESTLLATMTVLLHHGMVIVGLPYAAKGQMRLDEITGGSPLRRHDDSWRRRKAPTERERTRTGPLSGTSRHRGCHPATHLARRRSHSLTVLKPIDLTTRDDHAEMRVALVFKRLTLAMALVRFADFSMVGPDATVEVGLHATGVMAISHGSRTLSGAESRAKWMEQYQCAWPNGHS